MSPKYRSPAPSSPLNTVLYIQLQLPESTSPHRGPIGILNNVMKTKDILPKTCSSPTFPHLSKQLYFSSYSQEHLFSFSYIPYQNIPSANHVSFLAALTCYLSHLYTLVQVAIVFFLDHCSSLLSPYVHPCPTIAIFSQSDAFKTRGSVSADPLLKALQLTQHTVWDIQPINLAPGYFSSICDSPHSPYHDAFCLFFCSSDVPSTVQTLDLFIFKPLCWNVLSVVMVCSQVHLMSPC